MDKHEHRFGWAVDPFPLARAIDLVGAVTIGVLALTEHFRELPGALVAVVAAHLIGAREDTRNG